MTTTNDFSPRLLNVNQVADLLGCHRNTVWNHVRNEQMPKPNKFGGKTVWLRATIEEFIETIGN